MTVICPECEGRPWPDGTPNTCRFCGGHGTISDPATNPAPAAPPGGEVTCAAGAGRPLTIGEFTAGPRTVTVTWDPTSHLVLASLPGGGAWWLARIDDEPTVRRVLADPPADATLDWVCDQVRPWDGCSDLADPYGWVR